MSSANFKLKRTAAASRGFLATAGFSCQDMVPQKFWRHMTSSITWPLDSQCTVSYRWSTWTDRLSHTVVQILSLKLKDFADVTLTIWGHVTSSATWPMDHMTDVAQRMVSRRWSYETITRSRTTAVSHGTSKWSGSFQLKRSKVKVTGRETSKIWRHVYLSAKAPTDKARQAPRPTVRHY